MARDYYAVLEVGVSATSTQIRRAYQRLARQYSPDVNLWERDAHSLFEEIVEAYRVLSDPTARSVYDRQGKPGAVRAERAASSPLSAGRRGDDAKATMELSFVQSATGMAAQVPFERLSRCQTCAATGTRADGQSVRCDHCGGTGSVWRDAAGLQPETCPACDGAGQRVSEPCPDCRGRGVRLARAAVDVLIPAGVETGAQVRAPGEGHAGPFGGPRGDLVVITRVHEDPGFSRKGHNLYTEAPLTIGEAVLGARVPVRTLEGPAELLVPPGTQSGQVLRMRGRGLPRLAGEGRGDLYVTVKVEIPRGIDARTQELFRELGRLLPRPEGRS
jgi:molecular chaperone DnaJ